MRVFVNGVGIVGPALDGWGDASAVLRGDRSYVHGPLPQVSPAILTGELRRRSGNHIRLAVQAASEAVAQAGADAKELASVFATAEGDSEITHYICDALASPAPALSPTRFHNSVTNAPAGYWSMATGAMAPSTAISGHDGTFACGLIEAATQAAAEGRDVLLVAHDIQMPAPLDGARPLPASFAVALVLSPRPSSRALAQLDIRITGDETETTLEQQTLEDLRRANPAARALPLLAVLARSRGQAVLPYVGARAVVVELV